MSRAFDPKDVQVADRTPEELVADARAAMMALNLAVHALVPAALGVIVTLSSHTQEAGRPASEQLGAVSVFRPPATREHPVGRILQAQLVGTDWRPAIDVIVAGAAVIRESNETE